jgi:hypothetical protein
MARRRNKNSLYFYLFVFALVVFLFFRFGLNLFVDWAFLLTQHNGSSQSKKTTNSKITLISEPILEEVPDATNEAILNLKGRADPETQIELYYNNEQVAETNADFDGNFQFEHILDERNNQFYVVSVDPYSQKETQSKFYNVTFIDEPPSLEITSPQDGKKYYENTVNVEGTTDKEVFVRVNNASVVVKADGSFTHTLSLNKGDNELTVVASDRAGNSTEQKLKVTYVD